MTGDIRADCVAGPCAGACVARALLPATLTTSKMNQSKGREVRFFRLSSFFANVNQPVMPIPTDPRSVT
jgi:hypothetical protein